LGEVKNRFAFGGQPGEQKRIAFINLREIRGLKFGTPGPLVYNDLFYGTDLEILARGTLSLHIVDPVTFVRNFVPANVMSYSFDDPNAKQQILSEYMQSFTVALNSLSGTYRISQLPSQATEITKSVTNDQDNAGTWRERFGFEISKIGIESIEFSPDSKELVKQFSSNKMSVKAYEDVSQNASNIAAQQKIAQGIESHGLGDGGGMIFGMNLAQSLNSRGAQQSSAESAQATNSDSSSEISRPEEQKAPAMSWEERVNMVKKLKDLLDADILTQDEFDQKKKEILGL
jgi:membrane protease subunit (stomatin/prohibitin family)